MAQHDYVIANQSGASFRADLNNGLAAIVSNNSGASAPSTTFAFQWWADTTDNVLKMRNAANDGWITIRELDGDYETIGLNNGTAAAPSLYFAEDADDNTGLFSGGADQLNITTGGTERAEFGASEVVFNDGGANYDFRVEGDSNTNLVVVDASADSIGIGTNAPGTLIEIDNAAPYVTFKNNTEEDTAGGRESRLIFEGEQSGGEISTLAQIEVSHDGTADDEKGKLVISTNDGSDGATPTAAVTIDSSQNVTVAGNLTASGISYPSAGPLSNRNKVINGDMRIDQRNAGASVTPTAGSYTLDRWALGISQASKISVQQNNTSGFGFDKYVLLTVAASATVGSSDFFQFAHPIEGNNTADFEWGTSAAKTVTLSFYAYSSVAGTFGGAIRNIDNTRSYPFTYSLSAATWTPISITVPGDTTGTWYTDNRGGITILFSLGMGSTYSGTAESWASANYGSATGATSLMGTVGATFALTGVQLEAGTVATPFEHRSYGQELSLCQRYYQAIPRIDWNPGAYAGSTPYYQMFYKVSLRTAASVTLGTAGAGSGAWTADNGTIDGCRIYASTTSTITGYTLNSVNAEL